MAKPLLVIVGPTAAGKTALALERAKALGSEIISADSVQVYRRLDIGSAKPSAAERAQVRHHLIDLWEPRVQANAGTWLVAAEAAIAALHARDLIPVVCGGTGLYVRALLEGLAEVPEIPAEVSNAVRERLARAGAPKLHAELAAADPETAARLAPNDGQRVARALEVVLASGESLSALQARHRAARASRYDTHLVGVFPERAVLEARIASRARQMLAAGLVQEVATLLLAEGVPADAPGLRTLGYRTIVSHLLENRLSDAALAEALTRSHRQYAKRQRTWWRRWRFDEVID